MLSFGLRGMRTTAERENNDRNGRKRTAHENRRRRTKREREGGGVERRSEQRTRCGYEKRREKCRGC